MNKERTFADYKPEAEAWITLASGEYYPDILPDACRLWVRVLHYGSSFYQFHL